MINNQNQNKLTPILLQKQKEIQSLYHKIEHEPEHTLAKILNKEFQPAHTISFKHALQTPSIAIIAEIKRQSPSKGKFATIANPIALAERYIESGANALSVLTDEIFFSGCLDDLIRVANFANKRNIPVLRKDFIIDEIQIAEAAFAGAQAILLIVSVLGERTKALLQFAHSLQLDVLVEIHDEDELQIALSSGADIIGVNNRNLNTFIVNSYHALNISPKIPERIIKIAESGIRDPRLVKRYYDAGFQAVLIGEALVKSDNVKEFIESSRHE